MKISDIGILLNNLDKHLVNKFPKGVPELRNYIFNTHSKLEDWMGAVLTRESFKTVESSSLEVKLRGSIMADSSITVHRLITEMEFHALLKAFLKTVEDKKYRGTLEEKLTAVNRARNDFAHPIKNYLHLYDLNSSEGLKNQLKILNNLNLALETMEQYLLTYHKEWYLQSLGYNSK